MISKSLYLNIIVRILLLVLFSVCLGYIVFTEKSLRFSILCTIIIVILTVNLTGYLNATNKKIKYFFDSVRNDDSSLSFSVSDDDSTISEINRSMNRVNRQIQQLKIENRNQEQYFQILLEHIATGILTYNDKGFVIHANSSARKLLSLDVLTHLQQIEHTDEKLYKAIMSIRPSERRLLATNTFQGEIQLSLKATSLKTNQQELTILSIQDIKNELDEKEIESWMKLIRVLMHEIMNSITPITSLSESLSRFFSNGGAPVSPEQVTVKTIATTLQGLNVIKDQGRGLMSFVESYRKLTRIPEPEIKVFKIEALLNRITVLYSSLDKSDKIALSVSTAIPELEIFADQNLISQVLVNLLKNAIEANENNPDGKISIVSGLDTNLRPEICVADNGPGIAEENIEEIFVPFFTTRQNGSGIGLSISKQIMRVHGGNLKVRSTPGKETVFCLSF
jgi:nitrogen fixation/metabolism regulation signal transduction histidine kinase